MSDPVLRPKDMRRRPEELLAGLKSNLDLFVTLVGNAYNVALEIELDFDEIYERQLYRTVWGYKSMTAFCKAEFGHTPGWIKNRIDRAHRDRELLEPPPGPHRQRHPFDHRLATYPKLPNAVSPPRHKPPAVPVPLDTALSPAEAVERAKVVLTTARTESGPSRPVQAEPDDPEPDAGIAWLVRVLADLDPGWVIDHGSVDQVNTVTEWVEQYVTEGRARDFCEHHPAARSADTRVCLDCGRQVMR